MPVLWAIDELASCPVPLPTILRDAGSHGLLILGALQDLQQTTAKWGEEGKSLPTLFGNVVVTRGIRDVPTLEISANSLASSIKKCGAAVTASPSPATGTPR